MFVNDALIGDHWAIFSMVLGMICSFYIMTKQSTELLMKATGANLLAWGIVIVSIIYIGLRPLWCYADTKLYTTVFNMVQSGAMTSLPFSYKEWLFASLEYIYILNASASDWLLMIASFYIGGMAISAKIWFPHNFFVAIVFLFTSFSFFAYATNGIRNGMATSIAMLGLAFLTLSFRRFKLLNICIGFILIYLSTATHQSCFLILAAAIIAYLYRNTKIYCIFWICCILLSLIFTESLKTYLADSITDARMLNYLSKDADETMFSHTGFRWDFILYSAVPIVLGWYVIIKKGVRDVTYSFLLNVYIFANSFWCLINSAAYSNRFAYLSWFLMPVVICYPMLKFRVFNNQGMVCALFLLGQVIFNLIL